MRLQLSGHNGDSLDMKSLLPVVLAIIQESPEPLLQGFAVKIWLGIVLYELGEIHAL
jgi:hypothetical protein